MPFTPAQLKAELLADSQNLGYAPLLAIGSDAGLAIVLNFRRDGVATCPENNIAGAAINVRNAAVTGMDIRSIIDDRDFPASPTAAQLTMLQLACGTGSIKLVDDAGVNLPMVGNVRRFLKNTGDAGYQGSRERFDALINRPGSRAEKLWGPDTNITASDVALARIS